MGTLKLGAKNKSRRAVSKASKTVPSDVTGSTPSGYVAGGYSQPEEEQQFVDLRNSRYDTARKENSVRTTMSDTVESEVLESVLEEEVYNNETGETYFRGVEVQTLADGTPLGSSAATVLLGRVGHVEGRIQAGIKHVAMGGTLSGSSKLESMAMLSEFRKQLGADPKVWAEQIDVDESVGLPNSAQDIRTVYSMMGKTSGEYLDKGPGAALAGHTLLEEKKGKNEDDLALAYQYIKDISEHYVHKNSQGEARSSRISQTEAALTARFMDGMFADGSKAIIPLPNETGVSGLVPTMSYRGFMGTSFDRVGFANFAEERGISADSLAEEDRNMYWENMGSAKDSLVPRKRLGKNATDKDKEKAKSDQTHTYDTLLYKAHEARKILRKHFPTNFNESMGTVRSINKNRAYDDQVVSINLQNEANIQGLDFSQRSHEVEDLGHNPEVVGKGSSRGGMYGDRPLSEVDVFVEKGREAEEAALAKVEEVPDGFLGIKQRTPEWYKAREGLVTASGLIDEKGRELTADEIGEELAKRKVGLSDEFIGNDYTEEGTKNEAKVLSSFLMSQRKLGNNFTHEEVGLMLNKDLPGMGASPDGKLKLDGKNAGLIELKYLTTSKMKGALEKYTPQMQLQMMVTDEKEMYFHAYDRYTDNTITHKVFADKDYQEELKRRIDKAVAIGEGLDVKDLYELEQGRKKMEQTKAERKAGVVSDDTSGQTKSFSMSSKPDLPMKGFRVPSKPIDNMEKLYGPLDQAELNWRNSDPAKDFILAASDKEKKEAKASQEKADADKKAADAAQKTAKALSTLGKEAKDAANVLGEIAGFVLGGDSKSTDLRIRAGAAGLQEKDLSGLERLLKVNGLDQAASNRLVAGATDVAETYSDKAKAGAAYKDLMAAKGATGIPEIMNMELHSLEERSGLDSQQTMAMILKENQSLKSPYAKMVHANMYGNLDGITAIRESVTPTQLAMATNPTYNFENQDTTHAGVQNTEIQKEEAALQTTDWLGRTFGEAGGEVLGGLKIAAELAGSATMTYLMGKGIYSTIKGAKKVGPVLKGAGNVTAKTSSTVVNKTLNVSKSVLNTRAAAMALKATPMAAAVGGASYAARELGGIEDDGSFADSAMDVLEFAATGAAIGSIVPGVGTIVGGGIGLLGGLANEAYESFNSDPAVPSRAIPMPNADLDKKATAPVINIEVSNSISKDLIVTEVNEDGEQVHYGEDRAIGH